MTFHFLGNILFAIRKEGRNFRSKPFHHGFNFFVWGLNDEKIHTKRKRVFAVMLLLLFFFVNVKYVDKITLKYKSDLRSPI